MERMSDPTIPELEAKLKAEADKFTDENLNNPSQSEYLLIRNAMLKGWELGVQQAIQYMKTKGVLT